MDENANQNAVVVAGLPEESSARVAELDRLIEAGAEEMRQDIKAWQSDGQKRADHLHLLQMRAEDDTGEAWIATLSPHEREANLAQIEAVISAREKLMATDIRYHNQDAVGRRTYGELLRIRELFKR